MLSVPFVLRNTYKISSETNIFLRHQVGYLTELHRHIRLLLTSIWRVMPGIMCHAWMIVFNLLGVGSRHSRDNEASCRWVRESPLAELLFFFFLLISFRWSEAFVSLAVFSAPFMPERSFVGSFIAFRRLETGYH